MNWKDDVWFLAKRLWSVRMAAIGVVWASAASAWVLLPSQWQPTIPEALKGVLAVIGIALASAPGIAALVHQPKLIAEVQQRKYDPMVTTLDNHP